MLRIGFFVVLLMEWSSVVAQNTLYDRQEDQEFHAAVELMQKEKYGAARQAFDNYISSDSKSINKEEASYFRAFCALNLYHPDAEVLYQDFVENYNYHPRAGLAYYELGNFYFTREEYPKAIEYFEQVPLARIDQQKQLEARFKLAYAYFSQKEFDAALEKFDQVKTSSNRYSAAASYYAGYIEYKNGSYDQALVDLQRAETNESYAPLVPYMVANVYYKQERYDDLLKYVEEVLEKNPSRNFNELNLLAGEAYFFKGDYENAALRYDTYAKDGKKLPPDTRYKYAFATYHAGNYDTALEEFKSLASREEEVGQFASYYLGDIYLKQNNLNYAVASYQKASQDSFNPEIKEAASFKYCKVQYDLGNHSQAIDGLEQFLADYPASTHRAEADDLLSEAYLNTNDYDQAIRHLEQIQQKSPRAEAAYQKVTYYQGTEYFNAGKYFNAVRMFEKSLSYPIDQEIVMLANYWSGEAYSIGKKYPEAIKSYQAVIGNQGMESHEKYTRTRYGLGYAYYNTQEYSQALEQYSLFLQAYDKGKKRFYDDAVIRAADCQYVLKNYQSAIDLYDQAILNESHDQDYAILQKGTVLSIQGNRDRARENFTTLINDYPGSRFSDKALYQRSQLELESGNYQQAIQGFSGLIKNHPKSGLIPHAHTKRALAYYNVQQYDQTIEDYKSVLDNYINHESAHDALIGLQETLNLVGRSGEFDQYFAMFRKANPENSSLANIEYETAVNLYLSEDYQSAIEKFQAFIASYPDHNSVYEARFYIAESYYRSDRDQEAIRFYQEVVDENRISQVSRALRRLGDLWFAQGNYQNAIEKYLELEAAASSKKENYYAWSGLMESYYMEGDYDQVDRYAALIIEQGGVNTNAVNRSMLMRGKAAYQRKDLAGATDYFLSTLNTAQDENGAEAQYMLARIQHDQGQYQQSNETLYDLNGRFGAYSYWIGKSFLSVTDNYLAQKELFQARATLESIIENAPEEEIVEEAKNKLARLDQVQQEELAAEDTVQFEVIEE